MTQATTPRLAGAVAILAAQHGDDRHCSCRMPMAGVDLSGQTVEYVDPVLGIGRLGPVGPTSSLRC